MTQSKQKGSSEPTIREELNYVVAKYRKSDCTDEQLVERLLYVVSSAQVEAIDAVQDLFENPPAEIGAAEDLHYHTSQIVQMLKDCKAHVGELIP